MTQAAQRTNGNTSLSHGSSVAADLEAAVAPMFGGRMPVRIRAWDGTVTGPDDAPTVEIRHPDALTRLVYAPGELGLAQGYVTGELDVDGDLLDGFRRVWRSVREQGASPRLSPRVLAAGLRTAEGWCAGQAARSAPVAGTPARPPEQPGTRPRRDRAPLRPLQRLLRAVGEEVARVRCHRGGTPPCEGP